MRHPLDIPVPLETAAVVKGKPLVVELLPAVMRIRLKGEHYGYEIDYESVFCLAAKKAAEEKRRSRKQLRT